MPTPSLLFPVVLYGLEDNVHGLDIAREVSELSHRVLASFVDLLLDQSFLLALRLVIRHNSCIVLSGKPRKAYKDDPADSDLPGMLSFPR